MSLLGLVASLAVGVSAGTHTAAGQDPMAEHHFSIFHRVFSPSTPNLYGTAISVEVDATAEYLITNFHVLPQDRRAWSNLFLQELSIEGRSTERVNVIAVAPGFDIAVLARARSEYERTYYGVEQMNQVLRDKRHEELLANGDYWALVVGVKSSGTTFDKIDSSSYEIDSAFLKTQGKPYKRHPIEVRAQTGCPAPFLRSCYLVKQLSQGYSGGALMLGGDPGQEDAMTSSKVPLTIAGIISHYSSLTMDTMVIPIGEAMKVFHRLLAGFAADQKHVYVELRDPEGPFEWVSRDRVKFTGGAKPEIFSQGGGKLSAGGGDGTPGGGDGTPGGGDGTPGGGTRGGDGTPGGGDGTPGGGGFSSTSDSYMASLGIRTIGGLKWAETDGEVLVQDWDNVVPGSFSSASVWKNPSQSVALMLVNATRLFPGARDLFGYDAGVKSDLRGSVAGFAGKPIDSLSALLEAYRQNPDAKGFEFGAQKPFELPGDLVATEKSYLYMAGVSRISFGWRSRIDRAIDYFIDDNATVKWSRGAARISIDVPYAGLKGLELVLGGKFKPVGPNVYRYQGTMRVTTIGESRSVANLARGTAWLFRDEERGEYRIKVVFARQVSLDEASMYLRPLTMKSTMASYFNEGLLMQAFSLTLKPAPGAKR